MSTSVSMYDIMDSRKGAATILPATLNACLVVLVTFFSSLIVSSGIAPREETINAKNEHTVVQLVSAIFNKILVLVNLFPAADC